MIVEMNEEGKSYLYKVVAPEGVSENEFWKMFNKSDSVSELITYLKAKGYTIEEFYDFVSIHF